MLIDVDVANADRRQRRCQGEMVLFVFGLEHRKAGASLKQNWIPISLTNSLERKIFDSADCAAEGYRMRSNDKPVVGDMRRRNTRLCGDWRLSLIPAH
jgi:hypothetical protein